jgi:nucleoside-diphosphate kinase
MHASDRSGLAIIAKYIAFLCLACCVVGCDSRNSCEIKYKNSENHEEKIRRDFVVAIDGPACSGKGTLSQKVAERLGMRHIDSGLVYRKIASFIFHARKKNGMAPALDSSDDVSVYVASFSFEDALNNSRPEFAESVLRSEEMSKYTSVIAKLPEVRKKVTEILRKIVASSDGKVGFVIEGRDIGREVFPKAACKIFLTADLSVRARRRFEQLLKQGGKKVTYEEVVASLRERDWRDSHRKLGALRIDEDSIVCDITNKNIEESVECVTKIVLDKTKNCGKLLDSFVTLSIIKPDAVHLEKKINRIFWKNGLKIMDQKKVQLTKKQAEKFYAEHRGKEFFDGLCDYMSSGPIIVQILGGKGAVARNREIMGSTDPKKAKIGTIRKNFGKDIRHNAVHGSDSEESASREIGFFFKDAGNRK